MEDSVQLNKLPLSEDNKDSVHKAKPNQAIMSSSTANEAVKLNQPTENHLSSTYKNKLKVIESTSRVSPQHQPRLNPFNEDPEEELNQINNRNPFEDPNPFAQSESNPFEIGFTTTFEETIEVSTIQEEPITFSNMNGLVEHKSDTVHDLKYEVSMVNFLEQ